MKVIDLLNKIANGEINEDIKIEYQNGLSCEYCTIREFFDRYIIDKENLNLDIALEDTQKEDKKIEKLIIYDDAINWCCNGKAINDTEKDIIDKLNEIIDRLNGE